MTAQLGTHYYRKKLSCTNGAQPVNPQLGKQPPPCIITERVFYQPSIACFPCAQAITEYGVLERFDFALWMDADNQLVAPACEDLLGTLVALRHGWRYSAGVLCGRTLSFQPLRALSCDRCHSYTGASKHAAVPLSNSPCMSRTMYWHSYYAPECCNQCHMTQLATLCCGCPYSQTPLYFQFCIALAGCAATQ